MPKITESSLTAIPLQAIPPRQYRSYHVIAVEAKPHGGYSDGVPRGWMTHVTLRDHDGQAGVWMVQQDDPDLAVLQAAIDREVKLANTPLDPEIVMLRGQVRCILSCPVDATGAVRFHWQPAHTPPPATQEVRKPKPNTEGTLLDFFTED
jgi:hypothetical protein